MLSLVYSNIPPIKKGTDSRVGFGFRLGEHADFQVMFELGPQKFTKPIGASRTLSPCLTSVSIIIFVSICQFQENRRTMMIQIPANVWSIKLSITKQSKYELPFPQDIFYG